jgi:alpha-tubulin suppressor-like RCC1 family protein
MAITTDGALWAWGRNFSGQLGPVVPQDFLDRLVPTPVLGSAIGVQDVSAGGSHTLIIRSSNQLWGWGNNSNGQLGLENTTTRIPMTRIGTASDWTEISAAVAHSMVINSAGQLWTAGANGSGRTGLDISTGITSTLTRVGTASNWSKVSAGGAYTLAVTTNGQLWSWGSGTNGQLGLGDFITQRIVPTRVGERFYWSQVSAGGTHSLIIALL